MREIVTDIFNDPSEYMPVLLFLAALLGIWLALSVTAALALRRAIMRRGRAWLTLSLALVPLIFACIGVFAEIPFSWEGRTVNVHYDLHWFFLLPLLLGGAGLVFWWRARRRPSHVA